MIKELLKCPICKDCNVQKLIAHALVAPWISQSNGSEAISTQLVFCHDCTFQYFSHHFSSSELEWIYGDYRSESYFNKRHHWEPWYGNYENDLYKPNKIGNEISRRKLNMNKYLEKSEIKLHPELRVLDFGGDLGQFFPEETGTAYLYEPSAKSNLFPSSNLTIVNDLDSLSDIDLVMCCGVLEHLNEPAVEISRILKTLRRGGILYIEVPLDSFKVTKFHRSRIYLKMLRLLRFRSQFWSRVFMLLDFISGVSRNFFGVIPAFGIVKQSEHINYFNANSLRTLLEKEFEVINIYENKKQKHGKFRLGELVAVCRPRIY